MKYLILILTTILTVSCSSSKTISNGLLLHNTPLSQPDKSNPSYYNASRYNTSMNSTKTVDAWNYIRYNITANAPGSGMKILVVDSGISLDHTSFYDGSSNQVTQALVMEPYNTNSNYTELTSVSGIKNARDTNALILQDLTDASSHGTAVASVIVGKQTNLSDSSTHAGTAFGSTLGVIQIAQKPLSGAYNDNIDGLYTLYQNSSTLSNVIKANNYHIVNMSFGGSIFDTEGTSISKALQNNNVLFVASTGNNENNTYLNPIYPARYAKDFNTSSNLGGMLAVGSDSATTHNASTETFNYCGDAKAYCLVAPSTNITVANSSGTTLYAQESGTSFSTPQVSGAAAVLGGAFPSLTMKNIRDFLLRGATPLYDTHSLSADPTSGRRTQGGIYITSESQRVTANDGLISDVYGYGRLNLLESVKLVENTVIKNTQSSIGSTTIYTSSAIGNNLLKSLSSVESYDAYGTYKIDLSQRISTLQNSELSQKVSNMVLANSTNNFIQTNLANFGNLSLANVVINKELSYQNSDITKKFHNQMGLDGINAGFNRSNITLEHNISGISFGFTERYLPQSFNLTPNAEQFQPFYNIAFNSGNAKKVNIGKKFGNLSFKVESLFGNEKATVQKSNLLTSSQNVSHSVGVEKSFNKNKISVDAGILRESSTLLGSYSSGALFLGNNNNTSFAKIYFKQNIFGNTSFIGSFSLGRTTIGNSSTGLFSNFTPLISRSFIAGLESKMFGGNINITYSQPLAIISGYTHFTGANGTQKISLSPEYQEQNYSLSFNKQRKNLLFSVQTSYITNQNNLNVPPSFGGFIMMTKGF